MTADFDVSAPVQLAIAWQPATTRNALAVLFELDARLAKTIARAREPILTQMRLAWWRDRLCEQPRERPMGEPLLASVERHWAGWEGGLTALVDGWEELLGSTPLDAHAIARFARGRGAAIKALADLIGISVSSDIGQWWALADLAEHTTNAQERSLALKLGRSLGSPPKLPKALRGVAVLEGLAARALVDGRPMLTGRLAALHAWRIGVTGR